MAEKVIIRIADNSDIPKIQNIQLACMTQCDAFVQLQLAALIQSTSGTSVILCEENCNKQIVGFTIVEFGGRISQIGVLPAYRRRGIGSSLLDFALGVLRTTFRKSSLVASLHVDRRNIGAIRMYEKKGFEKDSNIKDFYGCGLDGWRMLREWP
jgi:ribosomal protein S18 acetylase RimI-like enzyme